MSGGGELHDQLVAYARAPVGRSGSRGRRYLRDLLAAAPALAGAIDAAGGDVAGVMAETARCAHWDEAGDRALSEMYWAGATPVQMALATGRAERSCTDRLRALGLSLRDRP